MNNAIKLAIEKGGYKPKHDYHSKSDGIKGGLKWEVGDNVILDPLFWQALGKALGWRETILSWYGQKDLPELKRQPYCQYKAHQYFDLLLSRTADNSDMIDGAIEEFWKELLK